MTRTISLFPGDSFGQPSESHGLGSIYGFLAPRVNAAKPAGEWQICDVTLVGRMVTVTLNGDGVATAASFDTTQQTAANGS